MVGMAFADEWESAVEDTYEALLEVPKQLSSTAELLRAVASRFGPAADKASLARRVLREEKKEQAAARLDALCGGLRDLCDALGEYCNQIEAAAAGVQDALPLDVESCGREVAGRGADVDRALDAYPARSPDVGDEKVTNEPPEPVPDESETDDDETGDGKAMSGSGPGVGQTGLVPARDGGIAR